MQQDKTNPLIGPRAYTTSYKDLTEGNKGRGGDDVQGWRWLSAGCVVVHQKAARVRTEKSLPSRRRIAASTACPNRGNGGQVRQLAGSNSRRGSATKSSMTASAFWRGAISVGVRLITREVCMSDRARVQGLLPAPPATPPPQLPLLAPSTGLCIG